MGRSVDKKNTAGFRDFWSQTIYFKIRTKHSYCTVKHLLVTRYSSSYSLYIAELVGTEILVLYIFLARGEGHWV